MAAFADEMPHRFDTQDDDMPPFPLDIRAGGSAAAELWPSGPAPAPEMNMRLSVPVIEEGALIAVAAQGDAGWFLIAIDHRLSALDRTGFGSAGEIAAAARSHLRRHHPAPPRH